MTTKTVSAPTLSGYLRGRDGRRVLNGAKSTRVREKQRKGTASSEEKFLSNTVFLRRHLTYTSVPRAREKKKLLAIRHSSLPTPKRVKDR